MSKISAFLRNALIFIAVAVVIVAGIEEIIYIPFYGAAKSGFSGSSTDFITIVLAAVAVILTALTIILAVAGFVGYWQIKDASARAAAEAAETIATKRVDEIVPRQVLTIFQQLEGQKLEDSYAAANAPPDVLG